MKTVLVIIATVLVLTPSGIAKPVDSGCVSGEARAITSLARAIHAEEIRLIEAGKRTPEEIKQRGDIDWHRLWVSNYDTVLEALNTSRFTC